MGDNLAFGAVGQQIVSFEFRPVDGINTNLGKRKHDHDVFEGLDDLFRDSAYDPRIYGPPGAAVDQGEAANEAGHGHCGLQSCARTQGAKRTT